MATNVFGHMANFDPAVETWDEYQERYEQYVIANDIADAKKIATLLTIIGGKTYALLRNLCLPAKPSEKTFDDLVKILKDHYSPKPLVIAERFRFYKRNQQETESIATYVSELKKLSANCEFDATLNDYLRDRLVCGMLSVPTQKKLLTEKDLTYQRAVEISVSMETATHDTEEIHKASDVHAMASSHKREKKSPTQYTKTSVKCKVCGRGSHRSEDCRFKDATCYGCNMKGHIRSACKQAKQEKFKNGATENHTRKSTSLMQSTVTSIAVAMNIWLGV